jgi:hypothetical protein
LLAPQIYFILIRPASLVLLTHRSLTKYSYPPLAFLQQHQSTSIKCISYSFHTSCVLSYLLHHVVPRPHHAAFQLALPTSRQVNLITALACISLACSKRLRSVQISHRWAWSLQLPAIFPRVWPSHQLRAISTVTSTHRILGSSLNWNFSTHDRNSSRSMDLGSIRSPGVSFTSAMDNA